MKQRTIPSAALIIAAVLAMLCFTARLYTVCDAHARRDYYIDTMYSADHAAAAEAGDIPFEIYGWVSAAAALALVTGILLINRGKTALIIYGALELAAELYSLALYFVTSPMEMGAAAHALLGGDLHPLRAATAVSAAGVLLCILLAERLKKPLYALFVALSAAVYMLFDGLLAYILYIYSSARLSAAQELYEDIGIGYQIDYAAQWQGLTASLIGYCAMKLLPFLALMIVGLLAKRGEHHEKVS